MHGQQNIEFCKSVSGVCDFTQKFMKAVTYVVHISNSVGPDSGRVNFC